MKRANYGFEPEFDEGILEEYRRASAEEFSAPPSTSLRQPPKEEPFRWPGLDQRRDTVRLDREELLKATKPEALQPELNKELEENLDDTVMQAKPQEQTELWALDINGGSLLLLRATDVVIGRKPQSIEGSETLTVVDPGRTLSKSHARLQQIAGDWVLQDLGSTNGSAVHEDSEANPLTEIKIEPGGKEIVTDSFRLGTLKVRLRKLVQ